MLGYKYPSSKHPQSEPRIFPNIDAAIQKPEQRKVPGAICIGLEDAIPRYLGSAALEARPRLP